PQSSDQSGLFHLPAHLTPNLPTSTSPSHHHFTPSSAYPLSSAIRVPTFPHFTSPTLPVRHLPSAICYLLSASIHPRRFRIILIILRQPNHRPLVLFPRARRRTQQIQLPPVIPRAP